VASALMTGPVLLASITSTSSMYTKNGVLLWLDAPRYSAGKTVLIAQNILELHADIQGCLN
jgi:hypothetical protein